MTYKYRVTLHGIKGFFRVYKVNSKNTLYTFHKQMRADMEFPADQPILFKAFDEARNVIARYGLFDLGDGAADTITMAQTVKKGITSFVYFYDVTNRKSVEIAFEGEIPDITAHPTLIDTKGPDPIDFENGYIAFEDLPEDQRHLPGEKDKKKKNPLEAILGDLENEDFEEDEDEDEDDDEEEEDDDTDEIYDGSEDVTL